MDRLELLKDISFGARVAEEETAELASYFVETDQWDRRFRGEVDVIKGEKGAGKSAIYALLVAKTNELFDKRILLITAERPRGTPVFKELVADPPASEAEFIGLWKLYILTLIAQTIHEYGVNNEHLTRLRGYLADQGFIEKELNLNRLLKTSFEYVRSYFRPKLLEATATIDPVTGKYSFSGKIMPGEPDAKERSLGHISIDDLAALAEKALAEANFQTWVLLDRLDVAFAETHELEKNALRALFRVYRDFGGFDHIKLKIFIRSDIWKRIVDEGFREASHITRDVVLDWSTSALLNLIVRRILKNSALIKEWKIDRDAVLRSSAAQTDLFYRVFPKQVDQGPQKPATLAWILSRCADATDKTAPREVIHLLNTIREEEVRRIEHGGSASENTLFDRSVFKAALPAVSKARLVQTIYAEYPDTEPFLSKFKGEKTEHTVASLAALWKVPNVVALSKAEELVEIGFFQKRGSREAPTFWVPFLYRDALEMIQGKAEDE
ncbi:MAG TPA: hypothetical protein VGF53_08010 [Pseudolabrys sp.]|jgi:hypothetical protein